MFDQISDPDAEADRQARLACVQLAVRIHEDNLQDDGKTVVETARDLISFADGELYP